MQNIPTQRYQKFRQPINQLVLAEQPGLQRNLPLWSGVIASRSSFANSGQVFGCFAAKKN